jgi:hypothetical protein
VNLGDNSSLDLQGFAPFGKVIEGLEVVKNLKSTMPDDMPTGKSPDQMMIKGMGNRYLDMNYPKLCKIQSAKVEK